MPLKALQILLLNMIHESTLLQNLRYSNEKCPIRHDLGRISQISTFTRGNKSLESVGIGFQILTLQNYNEAVLS